MSLRLLKTRRAYLSANLSFVPNANIFTCVRVLYLYSHIIIIIIIFLLLAQIFHPPNDRHRLVLQVLVGLDPITEELGPYVYSAQHIRTLVPV